jgi:hypothetical protein
MSLLEQLRPGKNWHRAAEVADGLATKCKALGPLEITNYTNLLAPLAPEHQKKVRNAVLGSFMGFDTKDETALKEFFRLMGPVSSSRKRILTTPEAISNAVANEASLLKSLPGIIKSEQGVAYDDVKGFVEACASRCQDGGSIILSKGLDHLREKGTEEKQLYDRQHHGLISKVFTGIASADLTRFEGTADKVLSRYSGLKSPEARELYLSSIESRCDLEKRWDNAREYADELASKIGAITQEDIRSYNTLRDKLPKKAQPMLQQDVWNALDSLEAEDEQKIYFSILGVLGEEGTTIPSTDELSGLVGTLLPDLVKLESEYYGVLKDSVEHSVRKYHDGGKQVLEKFTGFTHYEDGRHKSVLSGMLVNLVSKDLPKAASLMEEMTAKAEGLEDGATRELYFQDISSRCERDWSASNVRDVIGKQAFLRGIRTHKVEQDLAKIAAKYTYSDDQKRIMDAADTAYTAVVTGTTPDHVAKGKELYRLVGLLAKDDVLGELKQVSIDELTALIGENIPDLVNGKAGPYEKIEGLLDDCFEKYTVGGWELLPKLAEGFLNRYGGPQQDALIGVLELLAADDMGKAKLNLEKVLGKEQRLGDKKYKDQYLLMLSDLCAEKDGCTSEDVMANADKAFDDCSLEMMIENDLRGLNLIPDEISDYKPLLKATEGETRQSVRDNVKSIAPKLAPDLRAVFFRMAGYAGESGKLELSDAQAKEFLDYMSYFAEQDHSEEHRRKVVNEFVTRYADAGKSRILEKPHKMPDEEYRAATVNLLASFSGDDPDEAFRKTVNILEYAKTLDNADDERMCLKEIRWAELDSGAPHTVAEHFIRYKVGKMPARKEVDVDYGPGGSRMVDTKSTDDKGKGGMDAQSLLDAEAPRVTGTKTASPAPPPPPAARPASPPPPPAAPKPADPAYGSSLPDAKAAEKTFDDAGKAHEADPAAGHVGDTLDPAGASTDTMRFDEPAKSNGTRKAMYIGGTLLLATTAFFVGRYAHRNWDTDEADLEEKIEGLEGDVEAKNAQLAKASKAVKTLEGLANNSSKQMITYKNQIATLTKERDKAKTDYNTANSALTALQTKYAELEKSPTSSAAVNDMKTKLENARRQAEQYKTALGEKEGALAKLQTQYEKEQQQNKQYLAQINALQAKIKKNENYLAKATASLTGCEKKLKISGAAVAKARKSRRCAKPSPAPVVAGRGKKGSEARRRARQRQARHYQQRRYSIGNSQGGGYVRRVVTRY